MRLLDRYILRNFLRAYLYCIAVFFSIWLIFDISDNISTFLDDRVSFYDGGAILSHADPANSRGSVCRFRCCSRSCFASAGCRARTRSSRCSRRVSACRGFFCPCSRWDCSRPAVSGAFNYSLAPHAEDGAESGSSTGPETRTVRAKSAINGQIFRNRTDNRTWFIARFRPGTNQFTTVQVLQQDAQENIVANYLASARLLSSPGGSYGSSERAKVVDYERRAISRRRKHRPNP